jgi:hypothetical protein
MREQAEAINVRPATNDGREPYYRALSLAGSRGNFFPRPDSTSGASPHPYQQIREGPCRDPVRSNAAASAGLASGNQCPLDARKERLNPFATLFGSRRGIPVDGKSDDIAVD